MKVVCVLSTKGGVGKSTITCSLAEWFEDHGYRTSYLDMDPQGGVPHEEVRDEDAEVCLVDTPGQLSGERTPKWVKLGDVIVVPVLASPYDLPAFERTLDVVRSNKARTARVVVVVNRYDARRTVAEATVERIREAAGDARVATLPDTTDYATAAMKGKHAWHYRRSAPSGRLMDALGRVVEETLGWEPREEKRPVSGLRALLKGGGGDAR